jgi:hypothetical protein
LLGRFEEAYPPIGGNDEGMGTRHAREIGMSEETSVT